MNLETDKYIVDDWCKQRDMQALPNDYLSKYGFLVSKNSKDIAACWLYPFINTKRCMIDCMIANPDTTKEERNDAIDLLLTTIFLTAKDMQYRYITCNTSYKTIKNKLLNLNFVEDKNLHNYFTGEL